MSDRHIGLNSKLKAYIASCSQQENTILRQLRKATLNDIKSYWQISPEEGLLLGLLIQITKAKKTIEIGVYTGYSALVTALHLPSDGRVIACDISDKWIDVARIYWEKAHVEQKIDFRLGPASHTLDELIAKRELDTYDYIFIDADKGNYLSYYEKSLKLIKRGGLIVVDNVLWGGKVLLGDEDIDGDTKAIKQFNKFISHDQRIQFVLLPFADGISVITKK